MESEAETCVFRGSDGVSETRGWPPPQNQAKSALLTPERRFAALGRACTYKVKPGSRSQQTTPSKTQSPSERLLCLCNDS